MVSQYQVGDIGGIEEDRLRKTVRREKSEAFSVIGKTPRYSDHK